MAAQNVDRRLNLLRSLVRGGKYNDHDDDDGSMRLSSSEQTRRKVSAAVRFSARQRQTGRSKDENEEYCDLSAYLKSLFTARNGSYEESVDESPVLDARTLLDTLQVDRAAADVAVEVLAMDGVVGLADLRNYVSLKEPERLLEILASLQRKLRSEGTDFKSIAETDFRLSRGRLRGFIFHHLKLDLTKSETAAILRAINFHGGSDDSGCDVDETTFAQFLETTLVPSEKEEEEPIVDIQISGTRVEEEDLLTQGYRRVLEPQPLNKDEASKPCNLRHSARRQVFIWYLRRKKKNTRLRPIVDLVVASTHTKSALAVSGYTCVKTNLGNSITQPPQYLWIARAHTDDSAKEALTDLKVTVGREKLSHDAIHVPPDARGRGIRGVKTAFVRVDGNLNKGGSRDVFLWFRPRRGRAETELPAVAYIRWSAGRRRLEAELAARRALRQHAPPTASGAPDLAALFARHTRNNSKRLPKRGFGSLLADVGFNLEPTDREFLLRRMILDNADDAVSLEEFLSFCALSPHELDDVAEALKRRLREAKKKLRSVLRELGSLGSPNLTLAELAAMLRLMGFFLTQPELQRLASRFKGSRLDGEVSAAALLRFLERDSYSHDAVKRRAARVFAAADCFRSAIADAGGDEPTQGGGGFFSARKSRANAPGETSAAWCELRKRRSRRLRGSAVWKSTDMEPVEFLELEDVAMAVERQLLCDASAVRLSSAEYGQLLALVAPLGQGRVSQEALQIFASRPLRPLAELLRVLEHRFFSSTTILASYRASARAPLDPQLRQIQTSRLEKALRDLRFLDTNSGFAKLVSVTKLRRSFKGKSEDLESVTDAEWLLLAQHCGADVPTPEDVDEDIELFYVHPKRLLQGLCRLICEEEPEEDEPLDEHYFKRPEEHFKRPAASSKNIRPFNGLSVNILEAKLDALKRAVQRAKPNWRRTFRELDGDGDGRLSLDELKEGLRGLGLIDEDNAVSSTDLRKIFHALFDDAETISLRDFEEFFSEHEDGETLTSKARGDYDYYTRNDDLATYKSTDSYDEEATYYTRPQKHNGNVLQRIFDGCTASGRRYQDLFARHDTRQSGLVSEAAFYEVLSEELGVRLSERELRSVVDSLGSAHRGVDYAQLHDLMVEHARPQPEQHGRHQPEQHGRHHHQPEQHGREYGGRPHSARPLGSPPGYYKQHHAPSADLTLAELAKRVRKAVDRAKLRWGAGFSLKECFERYDRRGRGTIASHEAQAALASLSVDVSASESAWLSTRFERSNGSFDYRDFCQYVSADEVDMRYAAGAVSAKLSEAQRRGLDVRLPFEMADSSLNGFVSFGDFRDACRTLDLPITDTDLDRFAQRFEQSGRPGQVSYADFLAFVRDAAPRAPQGKKPPLETSRGDGFDGFNNQQRWSAGAHSPLRRRPQTSDDSFARSRPSSMFDAFFDEQDQDPNDPIHFENDFFGASRSVSPRDNHGGNFRLSVREV